MDIKLTGTEIFETTNDKQSLQTKIMSHLSFFLQIFMLFLNIYMYLYKYKHTCEKITHIF
jgi:hypothetical protein